MNFTVFNTFETNFSESCDYFSLNILYSVLIENKCYQIFVKKLITLKVNYLMQKNYNIIITIKNDYKKMPLKNTQPFENNY
jgi:hypothetical protein